MDQAAVAVMAFFMGLGALDKAFFDGRHGYGEEFVRGLNTIGPLALAMTGMMCVAPPLGAFLGPKLAPFFLAVGSDPAFVAGLFFGVDNGGMPLAHALAVHPGAYELFGVGLASTLGCIVLFPLPFSLAMASPANRPFVARGIAAALIASPLSMAGVALTEGIALSDVFRLGSPAFVVAAVLAAALLLRPAQTARAFMAAGRVIMGIFVLLLAAAAQQSFFGWSVIPGMAPIEEQLGIVGEIGVMLAGAYPFVLFVRRHGARALSSLSAVLGIDREATLGMFVSMANPLPMYASVDRMSRRGMVLCSAFSGPVLCALGDHLGFMSAYAPQYVGALLAGKFLAAFAALAFAVLLERISPSA